MCFAEHDNVLKTLDPCGLHPTLGVGIHVLLRIGRPLGKAIKDLITIVTPRTFARWLSAENPKGKAKSPGRRGRKPTPPDLRELILMLARENAWGYTRILGELQKLGVGKVSRSTVVNILKEHGLDPGPKRGEGTWSDFLRRHAQPLWATDFFSKKCWTASGLVDVFVLFFIHLGTRCVHIAGVTANPDKAWVTQQARNVAMLFVEESVRPRFLLRDHDTKFVQEFDEILAAEGVDVIRVGPVAPNMNAYAERWVQAARVECLDHFVGFGEAHLRHIVSEYAAHHNRERPHQGLGNRIPDGSVLAEAEAVTLPLSTVRCRKRLGGLLKHYQRVA